ncbi:type 1 glutamine amidotransferase domain-containing protein [Paenibacillus sp. HB172176]|uniref:type 1 glutamine amidotransferase domain-containing protein n=1 Tax=Paenibacillus sp. HB172176 TaxID=2493690 RepID=UPI00143B57D3|nr:type 1 glutamine amidotransferase domain-containing protein [Paenibacillus sp. HB172176]
MADKVAFLLASDFEDSEMQQPYDAVTRNGNEAIIISLERGVELKGKKRSIAYTSHLSIEEARAGDFDALIIPGGMSPAHLMENELVLNFVREMNRQGKPIAAICHGPLLLEKAGIVSGRSLTAYPELQDELSEAGAHYIDQPVVLDENWITSRTPHDEPYFIEETLKRLSVNAY